MKEYSNECPFWASTMVAFQKRFSPEDIARVLKTTIPETVEGSAHSGDDDQDPPNSGTLPLDATCCPADIAYSQDINLLNEAREKLEDTIDEVCEANFLKKPRTYRKCTRKDYLRLAKSKKQTEITPRRSLASKSYEKRK